MKKKIVLWGTDEADKKLLIAIELLEKENKTKLLTFPEEIATEELYKNLMDKWRTGQELDFPEGHKEEVRPLSVTDSLLPDNIKADKTDIINRAKSEWHFVVLSSKLYELYKGELEDLTEKVKQVSKFEKNLWEEAKSFWGKVQEQSRERNLFREHAETLKQDTNKVFDQLKEYKKVLNQEFKAISSKHKDTFYTQLGDIQAKIEKGLGLGPIFEELKKLQGDFRGTEFTREDRTKVWNRLDKAFKDVKEKRFGKQSNNSNSGLDRVQRRYDGLMSAIDKMKRSIDRDKSDQKYQDRLISETEGQLEQQIRQAKVVMIKEKIASKELRLADMMKTKAELEVKIEQEKVREEKRKEKEKIEKAKKEVKQKIANEIEEKNKAMAADSASLTAAAAAISSTKKKVTPPPVELPKDNIVPDVAAVKVEAPHVKVETPKEISEAPVAKSDKVEVIVKTPEVKVVVDPPNAAGEAKLVKDAESKAETITPKSEEKTEENEGSGIGKAAKAATAGTLLGAITTTVTDALEDVVETVKAVAEVVEDQVEEAVQKFTGEEE